MRQIIYAWNYVEWGGAQMYTLALIKTVRKEFDVMILLPEGSSPALLRFIEEAGVRFEFFSPSFDAVAAKGIIGKLRLHAAKWKSERALLRELFRLDLSNAIVHAELAPWQSLFPLIRLCRRTKVFVTMHNSVDPGSTWRKALWKVKLSAISRFRNFHAFTANVDAKNCFKGYFSDKAFDDIAVTYACVDSEEIAEVRSEEPDLERFAVRLGIPSDRFLVVAVGQFIDRKGRWDFLQAARKIRDKEPDTAFVWIANSAPSDEDLERVESFGLGNDLVFLTSDRVGKEHIELMRLLRCADVFALPSYVEGLPISLLEAMALGVPSVSTSINAIPEALKDRENGLLIEPGDVDALADAIIELKRHPELAARLSEAAMEAVSRKFTDTVVGELALERYRRAFAE